MKRTAIKLFTLIVLLLMLVPVAVPVFAADAQVVFEGGAEKFVFLPGSEYSDTDLFDNFKNIMPGDSRTQTVVVTNKYRGFDRINVYLRAFPHSESNPLSDVVASTENIASMQDFLSRLSMVIRANGRVIYSASPDDLNGLLSNVLLGTIAFGEIVKFDVELTAPIDLDNKYAGRMGELDWIFTAEQVVDPVPPSARVTVTAAKTLNGITPKTNEYSFQLKDSNGNVLQTAKNRGADVIFNSLVYDKAGRYTYHLSEVGGTRTDITYDKTVYTVIVDVIEVAGGLKASLSYQKNGMAYSGTPIFKNTTVPVITPDTDEIEVILWASKTVNRHVATGSDFTFLLHDKDGNLLQTKANSDGYIFFSPIKYDKPGTYVYRITEQKGSEPGMRYDSNAYTATVSIVEKDGKLESSVTYKMNGVILNSAPLFENFTHSDPELPPPTGDNSAIILAAVGVCLVLIIFLIIKRRKENNE